MLVLSLRSSTVIRTLACWRRNAPAVQLALAVLVGQGIVWFLGGVTLSLFLVFLGIASSRLARCGLSWLVGGISVGVVSAYLLVGAGRPSQSLQGELVILGTIEGNPRRPQPGEVTFEIRTGEDLGSQSVRCRAVDLPWRNAAHLEPGDTVWIRGSFKSVVQPYNPFSWEGWLWRRGVRAECKARFVSQPIVRAPSRLHQLRTALHERVVNELGESQGTGLFLSMALGYHDLLSTPLEKAFTRLGLTHLLVVSGYQVSLAFGAVLACSAVIAGWLHGWSRHLRSVMTALAFACAALYVVFIGAEMSAVRALMAAACICAHLLSDRETSFAQRWGVALLGMQILWPWCAFDIGVVLTFAALFGIGLGSEVGSQSRVQAFVAVTCVVWLCTTLVIVAWQGTVSPLGLGLNLVLAAPWSVLNCTLGLGALGIMLTGLPGGELPLKAVVWANQWLGEAILYLGELRSSSFTVVGTGRALVAIVAATTIALLVRQSIRSKRVRLA